MVNGHSTSVSVCVLTLNSLMYVCMPNLQVLHRVDLSVEDEDSIEFFTCFLPDPFHKGSVQLRTGSLIGLPVTFSYKTADDVDKSSFSVRQEKVDWSSSRGEELQNALVLSDKAKAFAIAREIFYVKSFAVHWDTSLQTLSAMLAYLSGSFLNFRLMLTLRLKLWARFTVFSAVAVAWFAFYLTVDDAIHCWYDNRVDESAAKLRKIYAEGGVEFYEKMLQRNCAMRSLMGSRGPQFYTYYGNLVSVWRNRSVQLTSRRDNLVKYLAEYDHGNIGDTGPVQTVDADTKESGTEV